MTSRSSPPYSVMDPNNCTFSFTAEGFQPICDRIKAKRSARQAALGVPCGVKIPPEPIPSDRAELEAEHAVVTEKELEALKAMQTLPPGQEREAQAFAMVAYRERRWLLSFAMRDMDTADTRIKGLKGT